MAPRSSKVLRETDIKKRYSLPTGFLSSLPSFNGGHAVDFQAVDGSGRVWPFRCSIRKKGHPKPVADEPVDRSGLAGMRQGELIRWYVDQQNQKNSYSSVEEAKNEASKIKAIIESLIRREGFLMVVDDGSRPEAEGDGARQTLKNLM